jgi:hypothetical protein
VRRIVALPAIAVLLLVACTQAPPERTPPGRPGAVVVDTGRVAVREFGGFGAEWDPYVVSADPTVPKIVRERVRFMRLPFVRVRMWVSWYSDVDNHYDFSNEDIRPLYDLLDATKDEGIDVILTEWGPDPDNWSQDPWVVDDPRYARAVADGVEHLIRVRGYTNIRYLVVTNEPDWTQPSYEVWRAAIENVHRELAERELLGHVRLMGPDTCCTEEWWEPSLADVADVVSAWDRHVYPELGDVRRGAVEPYLTRVWNDAREGDPASASKPFVLAESGIKVDKSTPAYAVDTTDLAIQAARAGTTMISTWMLDDESYPKGPEVPLSDVWGMWSTREEGSVLKPWFSTWSLLSRLVRPGSTLYAPSEPAGIRVLAARDPSTGAWTFVLVSRAAAPRDVTLRVPDAGDVRYALYVFDGRDGSIRRDRDGFPVPISSGTSGDLGEGIAVPVLPSSVSFVTTR